MVHFKRKPVVNLRDPVIADDNTEVWVIPETHEIFTEYESYIARRDFYKQKRFTCEISGHSGMSYFEARRSETKGSLEVDSAFPEALREPVLRRIQFSTISRIDNLVDQVFEDFKSDFYPGETVTIVLDDGARHNGQVREKAKFSQIKRPDGSIERKAYSRYFIRLIGRPDEEALVDDEHVVRDRKVFTKQMLRSFIKNTVQRESWNGAPWVVKQKFAREYHIDMQIPPHLLQSNKIAEKKAVAMASKKGEPESLFQQSFYIQGQGKGLPEIRPRGPKKHVSDEEQAMLEQQHYEEYQRSQQYNSGFIPPPGSMGPPPVPGQYYHNGHYYYSTNGTPSPGLPNIIPKSAPRPPPPPPIKYPIEDLRIPPLRDGVHRPAIKFMSDDLGISGETVGLLLETWNTLNVYSRLLQLDSFTFDDFVDAMRLSSDEIGCELFEEIHCAVLKKIVNSEYDQNGSIQISLPDLPGEEDEEEEVSVIEDSRPPTPTPEPEPPRRTTRSSLAKVENASDLDKETIKSNTTEAAPHRAAEIFGEYGWIERLRKRDFLGGGWQLVAVGLLHQLAGRERLSKVCEEVLIHLAPLHADPNQSTVQLQYAIMDVNLRTKVLQTMCMLLLETKAVKTFLEERSAEMTKHRKVKIEHQKTRKACIARLKQLNEERRQLQPPEEKEKSPSPIPELENGEDVEMADADPETVDSEDDAPLAPRSLRRGQDREAERKRKREQEKERREKAAEMKQTKGSRDYQRCLKKIDQEKDKIYDAEEEISAIDDKLREADCPRTRVLGKDRFCNRYWWFERNAMPYEGSAESSTADAGYANGRLWVQGPDDMEREGFIDVSPEENEEYYRSFQITPLKRKELEEGPTNVNTARDWGYYDKPEDVEMLIGWLDEKGQREIKLLKELNHQRPIIAKYMEMREEYVSRKKEEPEEPTATRMSTRTKTHVDTMQHRFLRWKNETALTQLGHKHIDPPPKPRSKAPSKKAAALAEVAVNEPVTTRAGSKASGKPPTRQGTRYNF